MRAANIVRGGGIRISRVFGSEGCEFEALSQFLNDSMRIWGYVPVTQIQVTRSSKVHGHAHARTFESLTPGAPPTPQVEVHVAARYSDHKTTRQLVRSYGDLGLKKHKNWNNPQSVREDRRARSMLTELLAHGFVPFHIDLGSIASSNLCCGTEYTLLNTRAPAHRLPRLNASPSVSRMRRAPAGQLTRHHRHPPSPPVPGLATSSETSSAWSSGSSSPSRRTASASAITVRVPKAFRQVIGWLVPSWQPVVTPV